jgi:hypothetical protein
LFESLKQRWAEARADVIAKSVDDILQRYQAMSQTDRYLVISAFESVHSSLEEKFGDLAQLLPAQKKEIARHVYKTVREAGSARGSNLQAQMSRIGAHGGALFSYFLELQSVPGHQAVGVRAAITTWREKAQSDLNYSVRN